MSMQVKSEGKNRYMKHKHESGKGQKNVLYHKGTNTTFRSWTKFMNF